MINNIISSINRHPFLKEQNMEEWMGLISFWLYNKAIYVMPDGISWCFETNKEDVEEYLKNHQNIIKKYIDIIL